MLTINKGKIMSIKKLDYLLSEIGDESALQRTQYFLERELPKNGILYTEKFIQIHIKE